MWFATIVSIFSYLSIEMIAVAAGEAKNPVVAVKSAFKGTILRLFIFYMLSIALMLAIVPWRQSGTSESPFLVAMNVIHLPYAGGIFNFIVLIAALSAMNSQLYITTRMMFSLSRAGQAPAVRSDQRARDPGECVGPLLRRHHGLYCPERALPAAGVCRDDVYFGLWSLFHLADDLYRTCFSAASIRKRCSNFACGAIPGARCWGCSDAGAADFNSVYRFLPHDAVVWHSVYAAADRALFL
jgi:hypothetical protein